MNDALFDISGKKIVVTGGTSGIGRMLLEGLASRGARVFTCSRKADSVNAVVAELKAKGLDVAGVAADLSKQADVERFAQDVATHFGGSLDVLVNNAGATWGAPIEQFPETGWDKVFDLNVKATFFLTQKCMPLLRKAGARPEALSRVINIGSVAGIVQLNDGAWPYHAAKAAVHHLTKTMAKGMVEEGIAVNAIAPGFFPSKMTAFMMPDGDTTALSQAIPVGRPGSADDILGAVVFLSSKAGAFCVGTVLSLDGGSAL